MIEYQKLDIIPTWRCQLACTYCFARAGAREKRGPVDMPSDVQDAAVDFLLAHAPRPPNGKGLGFTWYGGEPTLVPDVIDRMYARLQAGTKEKLAGGLPSNFMSLTPRMIEVAKKWRLRLQVSCDGEHGQALGRVRRDGSSSFDQVLNTMELHARELAPRNFVRITVTPDNVKHLAEDVRDFWCRGVTGFAAMPAFELDWTPEHLRELHHQNEVIADLIIEAFALGKPLSAKWLRDPFSRWTKTWTKPQYHCGAGRRMASVEPNGNMWPCHRFAGASPDDPVMAPFLLGNVLEGTFDEDKALAWNNVDSMRDQTADCATCPCHPYCSFPCVFMSMQCTGDLFTAPPAYCDYLRHTLGLAMKINFVLRKMKNRAWDAWWKKYIEAKRNPPTKKRQYPCPHRGDSLRVEQCHECKGKVKIKIFACAVHGECAVTSRRLDGVKRCTLCEERGDPKATPNPQPSPTSEAIPAA